MKISNSGFIALIVSFLHIVKASNEISLDTDRDLQTICSISATAKCTIVSAGVSCDMFRIYAHKCRTETVEMTYEWCNKNPDQVVQLDRTTTKIDLNNVPFSMNKRDIPANTCRKHIRRRDLDLCDPNNAQIFASITINGWSNPTQIGYTCYAHQYIQTRIVYPSPITLSPTSSATEKVTSTELEKIQVDPIVNCTIADSNDTCANYMANLTTGHPSCEADVIWKYRITNVGMNCGNITSIQATQDELPLPDVVLDSLTTDQREMCPGESLVVDHPVVGVNLCDYFGWEIVFDVSVNGGGDGLEAQGVIFFPSENVITMPPYPVTAEPTSAPSVAPWSTPSSAPSSAPVSTPSSVPSSAPVSVPTPVSSPVVKTELEKIQVDPIVNCTIADSNHTCANYMANLTTGHPSCEADVIWKYRITNVGMNCGNITSIQATQDELPLPDVVLDSLTTDQREMCPGESLVVDHPVVGVNLCDYFELEIVFLVVVNGGGKGLEGYGFVVFPSENEYILFPPITTEPTLSPTQIDPLETIQLEQVVICKIAGSQGHSCSEYMQNIIPGQPTCEVDIIWEYQITNEGTGCGEITSIQATLDDHLLPPLALTADQKVMCPGEILVVDHPVDKVNLCNFFGTEMVFEVEVNGGGDGLTGEGFVSFPIANQITFAPSRITVPTTLPVTAPVAAPIIVGEILTYEITSIDCTVTSVVPNLDCSEYLNRTDTSDSAACKVDIQYDITLENIGTTCKVLKQIETSVNGNQLAVDISGWSYNRRNFCPSEYFDIRREDNNVDICSFIGNEIPVITYLDEVTDSGILSFPLPPENLKFSFEIDYIDCEVASNGIKIGCADYLGDIPYITSPQGHFHPDCFIPIEYTFHVRHTGTKCQIIEKIDTFVDGVLMTISTSDWPFFLKEFCPLDDNLEIYRNEEPFNICQFAGKEIDVSINIADVTRETFLEFPLPNTLPPPTPPVQVENEKLCTSQPTEIWFQLNQRSCAASENQQGIGRRRKLILQDKLRRDLKSKGISKSASKKASSYKSYKSSSIPFSSLSKAKSSKKLRPSTSNNDTISSLSNSNGSKGGKAGSSKGGKGSLSKGGKGSLSKGGKGSLSKGGKANSSKGGKESLSKGGKESLSKGGKANSSKGGKGTTITGVTPSPSSKPPVEVIQNNISIVEGECKDHCMDIEFPAYIQIYSMDKSKMFFDGEVTENEIFKIGPCEIPNTLIVEIYKMEKGIKILVQELAFNTSCEDPKFQLGDTFGGLKIYGFTNEPQNTVMKQ